MLRCSRRFVVFVLSVLVALLLCAPAASARSVPEESVRFVELRAGPYYPNLNATPTPVSAAFRARFGEESRLMLGFEYDHKLIDLDAASAWFGVAVSYTRFGLDHEPPPGSDEALDDEYLALLPLQALFAVRLTGLAARQVPIVPYTKLGLGYGFWWSRTNDATAGPGDSHFARGASWGPVCALGALLLLDGLDAAQAAALRSAAGVEHSYLLLEWYATGLGYFGGDQLRIGAASWAVGLALEM